MSNDEQNNKFLRPYPRDEHEPGTGGNPGEVSENSGAGSTVPRTVASGEAARISGEAARVVKERLGKEKLRELKKQLLSRDLEVLRSLKRYRFLITGQIQRLHLYSGATRQANLVATMRTLNRLKSLGLVTTLERRIGGVRAGSSSLIWHLTEAGSRLVSGDEKGPRKRFPEPSLQFLEHTLAKAECAVQITTLCRESADLHLMWIDAEPDCWRPFSDNGKKIQLKPDLFVVNRYDGYEDRWFIEIDLGTESTSQVLEKCRAYRRYYDTGLEQGASDMFPLVVWIVPDEKRKVALTERIRESLHTEPKLFLVITPGELKRMLHQFIERSELC